MIIDFTTPQYDHSADDMQHELEALWKALNSCDNDTYLAVISLLGLEEAGSQPA